MTLTIPTVSTAAKTKRVGRWLLIAVAALALCSCRGLDPQLQHPLASNPVGSAAEEGPSMESHPAVIPAAHTQDGAIEKGASQSLSDVPAVRAGAGGGVRPARRFGRQCNSGRTGGVAPTLQDRRARVPADCSPGNGASRAPLPSRLSARCLRSGNKMSARGLVRVLDPARTGMPLADRRIHLRRR